MTVPPTGGPASTPTPGGLTVDVTDDGPHVTALVAGELLQETVPQFRDALDAFVSDPTLTGLVVDLTGTSFMDSTGLGALVTLHNRLLDRGVPLRVVRPPERVFRLFELTRLDTLFRFVERDELPPPPEVTATDLTAADGSAPAAETTGGSAQAAGARR